jgi:predicted transposase/invertase (TIGR01784 family)
MTTALNKGRAEGRAEEKLENARNLKANGVSIELIAKSLGLAEEKVEKL